MTNAMKQDTQFKVTKLNICLYYGNKVQIDCNGTICNIQSTSATALPQDSAMSCMVEDVVLGKQKEEEEMPPSNSKTYIGWIPLFLYPQGTL